MSWLKLRLNPKMKTSADRNSIPVLFGLLLLLLLSCVSVVLMFTNSTIEKHILRVNKPTFQVLLDFHPSSSERPIISNDSRMYKHWKGPFAYTLLKVYIFNYTNVDEYEKGNADKLHVEEVGPFVYEEFVTKVNIKFHPNDTVSFQEQKSYTYRADLSNGRSQNERVIVPNIVFMRAAAASEHSSYFSRVAMSTLISEMNSKPFLSLPANKFIWGYHDNLYTLMKDTITLEKYTTNQKIGLLISRSGTSEDVITVNTGKNDTNKIGQIDNFNGLNKLPYWSTEECNTIQGSDGMFFPPHTIKQKSPVHVYIKELCRSFPMVYEKKIKLWNGKVSAYKYILPGIVFDIPEINAENQCFCDTESGSCAPQGLFNSTLCSSGVPIFISFPHFYKADLTVRNAISGLKSNSENYGSYLNIDPILGVVVSGVSRIQYNIQVRKSYGMTQLDMFKDNLMLPISWLEVEVNHENFPDHYVKEDIDNVDTTTPIAEILLKYGCLLMALVAFVVIVAILYEKYRKWLQRFGELKRGKSWCSREEESKL